MSKEDVLLSPLPEKGEIPVSFASISPIREGFACPKCGGILSMVSLCGKRLQCPGGVHKWDPD